MFKKIKATALAAATIVSVQHPNGAVALEIYDGTNAIDFSEAPVVDYAGVLSAEQCSANITIRRNSNESASYDVAHAGIDQVAPGGIYYASGVATDPAFSPVNTAEIAFCANVQEAEITNLEEFGVLPVGGLATNAGDFFGYKFDYDGYRYTYGVSSTEFLNFRVLIDSVAPTVTLSSTTTTLNGTTPFMVTATFNEAVTGFDDLATDVTVTNGTITGITMISATVYALAVTPTGAGDVSVMVPAAAAQDAENNNNTASNTLVIGNTIVADTQKAIASFMLGRANNLASNQPGLTRFLQGDGCGAFNANATEAAGSINGCIARGNTWVEISSSWGGGNSYTLGTVGAHGFVNPDFLVGGMLQFDNAKDDANNASGTGWMVGPYFAAKTPDQPLFFEGRLLYGQTDNKISPLGTFTDSFETERMLAQLRATGEYKLENTTLMPLFDLTYTDDAQNTYTDSLGNTTPGQKVALTQVTAGMDFKTPLPSQSGALDLTGGLSGIYASTQGGAAQQDFEGGRGRAHVGLNYTTGTGATLNARTFYDGIGSKHEAYGANLGFNWKF